MTRNLYSFFIDEQALRWRAILWSWGAGTLASAIAVMEDGSTTDIAVMSLAVSWITFAAFVAIYLTTPVRVPKSPVRTKRSLVRYLYLAPTAAMVAILERIVNTPQAVHAATSQALASLRNETELPSTSDLSGLRAKAQRLIRDESLSSDAKSMMASDYAVLKAVEYYPQVQSAAPIVPNSRHRATLRLTEPGTLFSGICGTAFRNLNLVSTVPTSHLAELGMPGVFCKAMFIDVTIEGFTQELDEIVWVDTVFERCSLSYAGRGLTLVNVVLKDCKVSVDPSVPLEIRQAILSPNGPITLASID